MRLRLALAAAAAGVTAFQLSRPGELFGATADISVYLGSGVRLVHGALPYRDFDFVQPSAITLLSAPFAALSEWIGTRDALVVVRLCTLLLAALSVLLVGRVMSRRGAGATAVACAVMAIFPAQLYALQDGMLEPLMSVLCLAGVALVFDGDDVNTSTRTLTVAGTMFGMAAAIKLPALLPGAVLLVVLLASARAKAAWLGGGALLAFALPNLPFIVAAPGSWFRDVVAAQLMRIPSSARVPLGDRVDAVLGSANLRPLAIVALLAVVLVLAAAYAGARRPSPLEWFALSSLVLLAAAQLLPAQYYPQYAAFLTPFLAIALGCATPRIIARARLIGSGLVAAPVLALAAGAGLMLYDESAPDVSSTVDAVIPARACALSDSPKYLVTSDRFVSDRSDCPLLVDPFGTTLARGVDTPAAHAFWRDVFARVDYVVSDRPVERWYIGSDAVLVQSVHTQFHELRRGPLLFYVRSGAQ